MEKIAMWGGVAGIVIALFAIVILYLTRNNIIDLLDRDVVMYDKNYEAKKESLENAFNCLDVVALNGTDVKNNPQYMQRAKEAYNGLLCTVNSAKLYQEFYRLAVDNTASGYSVVDIEKFKVACRRELIRKHKSKSEAFKGATMGALNNEYGTSVSQQAIMAQRAQTQPMARPAQPAQRPMQRPPMQPPKED